MTGRRTLIVDMCSHCRKLPARRDTHLCGICARALDRAGQLGIDDRQVDAMCRRKRRFGSWAEAIHQAVIYSKRRPLRVYACPLCDGWHLTARLVCGVCGGNHITNHGEAS